MSPAVTCKVNFELYSTLGLIAEWVNPSPFGAYPCAIMARTEAMAMFTVGILTISDAVSKGQRHDTSGENIERTINRLDVRIDARDVVPDERDRIGATLLDWCDKRRVDLILTTGGTGLGPRDVTPEATRDVIQREVPGLAELMRMESAKANIHAVLSRAVVGTRGTSLIVNLPGSPKGVVETLELLLPVLPHAIRINRGEQADHTPPSAGHHRSTDHEGHGHDHLH